MPTAVLICFDTKSEKHSLILWSVHFLLIYVITLFLLNMFGWCSITPVSALITFIAIIFVYLLTCLAHYINDESHMSVTLHQLAWLKILDSSDKDGRKRCYQLLVNPTDNPELFKAEAA